MDSLRPFQEQITASSPEKLEKSVIRKTKEGYSLEKLTLGTRICRWIKPDNYNTVKNLQGVFDNLKNLEGDNPFTFKETVSLIQALHTLSKGKDKTALFLADATLSLGFHKTLTEIKSGNVTITSLEDATDWKQKLISLKGHPDLQKPTVQTEIRRIENEIRNQEDKDDPQGAIFRNKDRLVQQPWQEAKRFVTHLAQYMGRLPPADAMAFCASPETMKLAQDLRGALLPHLQETKEPETITVPTESLREINPLKGIECEEVAEKALLEKWTKAVPDFKAIHQTFARVSFDALSLEVNGHMLKLGNDFQRRFPEISSFSSVTSQAVKVAFICETLYEQAKEAMPGARESLLQKMVAESIVLCTIDCNPISTLPNSLIASFQLLEGAEGQECTPYIVRDAESGVRSYRITFSKQAGIPTSSVSVSAPMTLFNMATHTPVSTMLYTTELSKHFSSIESNWEGKFSKE